jgi:hypothetical protein
MRRFAWLCAIVLVLLAPLSAQAAPLAAEQCFAEVPYCISGRFEQYWRTNGGLVVFGLPLTTATKQRTGEGPTTYLVQVFERASFELHPHDPRPYDVQLRRLGVEMLAAQGRDWQSFPKSDPNAPHYFPETGQAIAPEFWGFWSSHGLEFDGNKNGKSFAESLALFGMPISPAQWEQSSDGNSYLVQWFERARFEHHPEAPADFQVQLGLLGAELLSHAQAQAPTETPSGLLGVPPIEGACVQNAPPAAEGAQAWMTNPEPDTENQPNSVCVRLIIGGQAVKNAKVSMVMHYRRKDVKYGPIKTREDGVAEQGFYIGDRKLAQRNNAVLIDITITAPDGTIYTTTTSFTPRFAKN